MGLFELSQSNTGNGGGMGIIQAVYGSANGSGQLAVSNTGSAAVTPVNVIQPTTSGTATGAGTATTGTGTTTTPVQTVAESGTAPEPTNTKADAPPPELPIYRKTWFWLVVAAVVLGGGYFFIKTIKK